MADINAIPTRFRPPGPAVRWAVRLLAMVAAAMSAVLLYEALASAGGGLPGCGAGSGCGAVLSSRWSAWRGVPVSLPAVVIYAAIAALSWRMGPGVPERGQRSAWTALLGLSAVAAAAAVWFIFVQLALLGHVCRYCTAVHACGLLVAALVWLTGPIGRRRLLPGEPRDPVLIAPTAACGLALLAILPAAALVLGQVLMPDAAARVDRVAGGDTFDTGPGPDRRLTLLNGAVHVRPHDFPTLGSADAPVVIAELYDYTCPHCRRLHTQLAAARERYGGRLAILMLPVPLDADCNPLVVETGPRQEDACELAKLAMAVWLANPAAFEAMHDYLMAGESPPVVAEAQRHAAELVGADALTAALDDPWVGQQVQRSIGLYRMTGGSLPQLLTTAAVIRGRPHTAAELFALLEAETPLQSPQ